MPSAQSTKMIELLDTLLGESDEVLQIASSNAGDGAAATDKVSWKAVEADLAKVSGKIEAIRDYVKTRSRE